MSGEYVEIHRTKWGTYHSNPKCDVAWTVNDNRGNVEHGPSCDHCGACECLGHDQIDWDAGEECAGLSFAFVCLDGGETLCEACAHKEGVRVGPCDCPYEACGVLR